MRKSLLFFCLLLLAAPLVVKAQDPQFSQFYAAPLYLNPAFAGSNQQMRVGLNYRNQWPAIEANFQTYSAYVDGFIESKNSGVGMLLMRDQVMGTNSTMVGLQYAYQLYLTEWLTFRPGFQAAFYNRNINFSDLTFANQFDPNTGLPTGVDSGEDFGDAGKSFIDLSAGGMLYTKNMFLGLAAHHLNTPNQSFSEDGDPKELPIKYSFHGGVKIPFKSGTIGSGVYSRPQERSLTPTFQYKKQGEFDQLDMGLYLTLEPILIGTWYRGLPFKSIEGFSNNESIVLLVGFTKKGGNGEILNIGYSYDYTISKLGAGSGGAHELSISYSWSTRDPRKPPRNVMQIPCPDF
ncbi:PorP/SprF family type IX secretion system membrane protein [Fulvivirga ligni]|uniref:PorP/SprF family type IX secretion system membrane protein n=1 Tax=Fulvivirga ligni TaxID=2904246 RepID=UPI001F4713BF|nr:type IX secretion system membrane protein PorP/SprF [Fulvivirga ligni]UII20231.1 type IX secretion system membrane protein PorP/SprF [Fulvivirga ligni]